LPSFLMNIIALNSYLIPLAMFCHIVIFPYYYGCSEGFFECMLDGCWEK
jgi:hypothetical protein